MNNSFSNVRLLRVGFILLFVGLLKSQLALGQDAALDPNLHSRTIFNFATLQEIKAHLNHPSNKNMVVTVSEKSDTLITLTYSPKAYYAVVKYLGQMRKIEAETQEYVSGFLRSIGQEKLNKPLLYQYEVRVEFDADTLWFPLQESLRGFWNDELKKDDLTFINFRAIGIWGKSRNRNPLLFSTGFHANYSNSLWNEALAHVNAGRKDQFLRLINKLIYYNPTDAEAHASLGYYYAIEGSQEAELRKSQHFEKAETHFKQFENHQKNFGFGFYQWAVLKFHQNDFAGAWEKYDQAKAISKDISEPEFEAELGAKMSREKYLKVKKEAKR